jgi:hypothetical protein
MALPKECPKCHNTDLLLSFGAPNEAWCDSCDSIVEMLDDGTTKGWSGTRYLTEGI